MTFNASTTGAVLALALAVAVPASAGTVDVKAGIAAWQNGDYDTAVADWRPLAEKGDADAAFNLGQAYRLGKGVPISLGQAQQWYEAAARKGHLDAATSLGILLFQNGNRTGAIRWLRQAADGGEPRAQLVYGTALYNGDGIKPDPVLAYSYVSRAAAKGLAPARATLADMDSMMPLPQRQKGVAIAQAAIGAKTKLKAPVAAPKPPPEKAAPVRLVAVTTAPPKPISSKAQGTKPAAAARAAPSVPLVPTAVASSGWRVQLGAFSKKTSAETLFRSLSAGSLAGRQAYYIPVGAMTRLQAGPFTSKAEATAACARLSAKGQPCFPVAAR